MKGEQDQRSSQHPGPLERHFRATTSPKWWSVHGPHVADPGAVEVAAAEWTLPLCARPVSGHLQQPSRSSALGPPRGESCQSPPTPQTLR